MSEAKAWVQNERDVPLEGWPDGSGQLQWRTLISGDRTPTDSLTLGVVEIEETAVSRWHRHAHAEVYYVLAGRGVVTIDGVEHAVEAGSIAFIPGNAEHGARSSQGPMRLLYAFAADSFDQVEYVFSE